MHTNTQSKTVSNINNKKEFKQADAWLRLKIAPKATKENPKPSPVNVTRDVPLFLDQLVARSMVNAAAAYLEANPDSEPLAFNISGTIHIPVDNATKEDLVF